MRRFTYIFISLALAAPALAQQCAISFTLSSATSSGVFNNLSRGCTDWTVTYNSTGFTGLTFTVQTAPNSSGSPGAWSTFAATGGLNPSTATDQATATFSGYFPFVRVNLSGLTGTGTVTGLLYGTWTQPASSGGCPDPCPVIGPDAPGTPSTENPVQVAGNDGTNVRAIKTDTAGNSVVVGPVASGGTTSGAPILPGALTQGALTVVRSLQGTLNGTAFGLMTSPGINTNNGHQPLAVDFSGGLKLASQGTALADGQSNTISTLLTANSPFSAGIQTFPSWFDGTTWDRARGEAEAGLRIGGRSTGAADSMYAMTACDSSAIVTVAAGATTEIVALTAARTIRVCSFTITGDTAAGTFKFVTGTGANCGTGTADVTGAFNVGVATVVTGGAGLGELFKGASAGALCITTVTSAANGTVSYAKF